MRLEDHRGIVADPATAEHVALAIDGLIDDLTQAGYVLLSSDEGGEEYVQASRSLGEDGFFVERRDGCAGEHYRGDRRVSASELAILLLGYLRGSPDWSHGLAWRQIVEPRA